MTELNYPKIAQDVHILNFRYSKVEYKFPTAAYSPAKCYAIVIQVTADSIAMDHATCITTGSTIGIVQGSEDAEISLF